jgi:hypothetical protein
MSRPLKIQRASKGELFRLRCSENWLTNLKTFALLHEFDASDVVRIAVADHIARAKAAANPGFSHARAA